MPHLTALARLPLVVLTSALLLSGFARTLYAADPPSLDPALGAQLPPLLDVARDMNPSLTAAALNAQAALSRAQGAGTLPDPTFRVQLKDIDREPGGVLPQRLNRIDYSVEQEFPLWGKRDLARGIAHAQANQAGAERDRQKIELLSAVKQTFAEYYVAAEALAVVTDLRRTVTLAADAAQQRYARGLGSQQDAIAMKVEAAELDAMAIRKDADQRRAAAKLNALLNRPMDAPLAAPETLPAVPDSAALSAATLFERARAESPLLKDQAAAISAATDTKSLVEKSWYPDVTLGLSVVDQSRRWQGYEAMVAFKIPLNTTLRKAETSAAVASLGAAQNRRDALEAEIRGGLEAGLWNLKEAQKIATLLHENHIPQTELALKSALAGYAQNRVALPAVLDAARHALENKLEHLSALLDQQKAVIEIERLVGGTL